jgi:predicted PolB exonuclease-like 3'-5' exonuclease
MQTEEHVREKFIKDFGLPIIHPRSPYFEYALDTYEEYYGAKTKFNNFIEATQRYGGFKQFTQDAKKLSLHIGELMTSTPAYKQFSDRTTKYFFLTEHSNKQIRNI